MSNSVKSSLAVSGYRFLLSYIGAVLAIGFLLAFSLWKSHQQEEEAALVAMKNITAIVEARIDATLRRIQANLEQLGTEVPDAALDPSSVARFSDQISHNLSGRASYFPELSSFRIFSASGESLYESSPGLGPYNILDRDYFRRAKAAPQQPLHFSNALVSKASNRPVVVVARPLTNPDKHFRGVVVGALEMKYFTEFFSTLDLGAGGSISFRRTEDGAMLARWPDTAEALNVPYKPDHPLIPWLASGTKQGAQNIVARADGIERLYVYSRLETYPFFIIVGRTQHDYLATWHQTATTVIGFSTVVLLFIGFILWQLWRAGQIKAETGLRNFKAIVDSTDDAVISKTLTGIIRTWNTGAEKLFGYTAEEAIGQSMQILFPPERLNEEPEILGRIAEGRRVEHFETVRRCKDGRLIDISATISPVFDETGKVIGASNIARDITERKQMEEELKSREIKLSTIIDTEPECVKQLAGDGSLLSMNRAGLDMIEADSLEQVVGQKVQQIVMPEHRDAFKALIRSVFEGKSANLAFEIQGLKGGRRWLETHSVPLRNAAGEITALLGVTRDISERKLHEAAQAEAKRQLESQLAEITELQQRLLEQVIRDPLTGIHNRRYLDETLPRELSRAKREGYPLAVIMIDLDHFKVVNDTYGHAAGDEVLKTLAVTLRTDARESDIICRYGGEEFLIALPGMSPDQAMERVDAWRQTFAGTPVRFGELTIDVTLSAGVAGFPDHGGDADILISRADAALYQSKSAGRNCVTCFNATS